MVWQSFGSAFWMTFGIMAALTVVFGGLALWLPYSERKTPVPEGPKLMYLAFSEPDDDPVPYRGPTAAGVCFLSGLILAVIISVVSSPFWILPGLNLPRVGMQGIVAAGLTFGLCLIPLTIWFSRRRSKLARLTFAALTPPVGCWVTLIVIVSMIGMAND